MHRSLELGRHHLGNTAPQGDLFDMTDSMGATGIVWQCSCHLATTADRKTVCLRVIQDKWQVLSDGRH